MSSDLKVTNIKHESSSSNNLVLASDGSATINQISSSSVFPAGHILQIKDNYYTGTIHNSSTNFIHVISQSITFKTANPNIIVFASTGAIDRCDGRLNASIFYSTSAINDSNINSATLFGNDVSSYANEPRVSAELGRGLSNTGAETHRPNASYHHRVSFTASANTTYYFALGIKALVSGTVRIGNGTMPTIMIMEVKS